MKPTNNQQSTTKNLLPRPPIVVVMGHVDHGKTTLLSKIRQSAMPKEPGEITQSIGAYEIVHTPISINQLNQHPSASYKITFIDTPGHEAFSKMRQRGVKVADLGILVVAADEGVKPQTEEAIKILKESQTPFIVAINKIDKTNADIERTKQELMEAEVLLEGFGGDISWQAISAKTGQGINELLDLISLAAEMEQLVYNPEAKASGVIIETKMDSRRGLTATAIVKNGILKAGDEITTPTAVGKVKILENFLSERVNELSPSSPALIIGFENMPQVGEEFFAGRLNLVEFKIQPTPKIPVAAAGDTLTDEPSAFNFIIKADVTGSLEALCEIIETMPAIKIISREIGDITDGDVKNAINTNAIIVGFRVKISKAAENLAKTKEVEIIISEIIYELIKNLEERIKKLKEPRINGELEILAIFGAKPGKRQIIGGRVKTGIFKNNLEVKIQRREEVIGEGKIINLQCGKKDTGQVSEGAECGILFDSETMINVGDKLIY